MFEGSRTLFTYYYSNYDAIDAFITRSNVKIYLTSLGLLGVCISLLGGQINFSIKYNIVIRYISVYKWIVFFFYLPLFFIKGRILYTFKGK